MDVVAPIIKIWKLDEMIVLKLAPLMHNRGINPL